MGDAVDAAGHCGDPVRRQIEAAEVCRAVVRRLHDHPAPFDGVLVALGGRLGIGLDAEAADASGQLAGGEGGGIVDDCRSDPAGRFLGEVGGAVGDGSGPGWIDEAPLEGRPDPGEAAAHQDGGVEVDLGGAAGQPQRGADLGGGGFPGQGGIIGELGGLHVVGDRGDGGIRLSLEVRHLVLEGPEHEDSVVG